MFIQSCNEIDSHACEIFGKLSVTGSSLQGLLVPKTLGRNNKSSLKGLFSLEINTYPKSKGTLTESRNMAKENYLESTFKNRHLRKTKPPRPMGIVGVVAVRYRGLREEVPLKEASAGLEARGWPQSHAHLDAKESILKA